MYTIGEFAAFGRVSVRMLRHYDAIGLLAPADVDERTGYRRYVPDQLRALLRITELRGFGCGLDDIGRVLAAGDDASVMRIALLARRAELEASVAADTARVARIDERLRELEGNLMSTAIDYRFIEPATVYAAAAVAPGMGPENVSPVVGPLIDGLAEALTAAGRPLLEPGIFWYDSTEDADSLQVHVSFMAEQPPQPGDGWEVVELPGVPTAAVLTHHGEMARIGDSWMRLTDQLTADGYRMTGPGREVYLESGPDLPQSEWVTELQAPVERAG